MVESVVVDRLLPTNKAKDHTAAYKIFHYQFLCRIAQMHLYSAEYLQQAGMLTTGNSAMDRATATEMVDVRLTIAGMAEYLNEGATIAIMMPEDTAKIYRLVKAHLDDWLEEVQRNPHKTSSPTEDLRKLDALAAYVYPHAKIYLNEKPFHGRLADALANISRSRGLRTNHTPQTAKEQQQAALKAMPQQHTPMADSIAQHTLQRSKGWDSKTPR